MFNSATQQDYNIVTFVDTPQGEIVDSGAIRCQKCITLEQSDWSQEGCLNTANLATSQAELASEASFRLFFLINSWAGSVFYKIKVYIFHKKGTSSTYTIWKLYIVQQYQLWSSHVFQVCLN